MVRFIYSLENRRFAVGQKTAQKIVIDLKEKVAKAYALQPADLGVGIPGGDTPTVTDAIAAMIALGYSPKEAREAIQKAGTDGGTNVETILKKALASVS